MKFCCQIRHPYICEGHVGSELGNLMLCRLSLNFDQRRPNAPSRYAFDIRTKPASKATEIQICIVPGYRNRTTSFGKKYSIDPDCPASSGCEAQKLRLDLVQASAD